MCRLSGRMVVACTGRPSSVWDGGWSGRALGGKVPHMAQPRSDEGSA
jgi:hypothetical protein